MVHPAWFREFRGQGLGVVQVLVQSDRFGVFWV